jgi:predicted ATPase with chaperone activity
MFVYGPPGNGKTVISQSIRKLLDGTIAIPHAILVEGAIIRLFDPVNHEPIEMVEDADQGLDLGYREDHRWIRCRRPMVMVGGELTLEQLELSYNATTGFYRAPVQAVANGGVLVIDDFGRQQVAPRDLLNRWIVPLESRVDFLTLQSGQKFELPFMVLVIFATNIKPAELVDEAFLRRIHYKVFAESPTVAEFMQIFENCCRERGVGFDRTLIEHLLQSYYKPRNIALRGCQPRDLLDQVLSLADYRGEPRRMTAELLQAACASYFVDEKESPVVYQ